MALTGQIQERKWTYKDIKEVDKMAEQIEFLLRAEKKAELVELLQIIDEMSIEEQKAMLIFARGAKWAKGIESKTDIIPTI